MRVHWLAYQSTDVQIAIMVPTFLKLDLNETVEEAKGEQKFAPWFFLGTNCKEFWIGNWIRRI